MSETNIIMSSFVSNSQQLFDHLSTAITAPTLPPLKVAPIKKTKTRVSKISKLGKVLREGLLKFHSLRRTNRSSKAKEAMLSIITESREGDPGTNESALRSCRLAALKMEEVLFSFGGA